MKNLGPDNGGDKKPGLPLEHHGLDHWQGRAINAAAKRTGRAVRALIQMACGGRSDGTEARLVAT